MDAVETILMIIVGGAFVAVVIAIVARSPGGQRSILLPAPPARTNSPRSTRTRELDDGEALGALLLVLGAAWLGGKVVKAGFALLKEVDWDRVGADLKRAIEQAAIEVERQPNVTARLDRAEQLLMSGGEINLDQAAMLTSATLELGLRTLAKRHGLAIAEESDSLAGLAVSLGRAGHIAPDEQRQIQYYASRIRNRVMHGQLGVMEAQEVASFLRLARCCLSTHRVA